MTSLRVKFQSFSDRSIPRLSNLNPPGAAHLSAGSYFCVHNAAELYSHLYLFLFYVFIVDVIICITEDSWPGQGILATAKIGHGHCGHEEFLFSRALRPNARAPAAMTVVAVGKFEPCIYDRDSQL